MSEVSHSLENVEDEYEQDGQHGSDLGNKSIFSRLKLDICTHKKIQLLLAFPISNVHFVCRMHRCVVVIASYGIVRQ